jgi:hypothetical protein
MSLGDEEGHESGQEPCGMSGPQSCGTSLIIQLLDLAVKRLDRLPHLLRKSFDLRVCLAVPPPSALAIKGFC